MYDIILKGHTVVGGKAAGEALVSSQPISFLGGVDSETGIILDKDNEMKGHSVSGKILVFPAGKGSSAGSYRIYEMVCSNTAPKGIINLRAEPVVATGAIFSNIPMIDRLDGDPLALIKTGDYVEIDADEGIVKVRTCKTLR